LNVVVIIDTGQDLPNLTMPVEEILTTGRSAYNILHDYEFIVKYNNYNLIVKK